jgi:hypothetical protein
VNIMSEWLHQGIATFISHTANNAFSNLNATVTSEIAKCRIQQMLQVSYRRLLSAQILRMSSAASQPSDLAKNIGLLSTANLPLWRDVLKILTSGKTAHDTGATQKPQATDETNARQDCCCV